MNKIIEFERAGMQWAATMTAEEYDKVQCDLLDDLVVSWKEQFGKKEATKNIIVDKVHTVTYEW